MKTIVYFTVNKENDKIYIGIHDVEDDKVYLWDGYYGNGINKNYPSTLNFPKTPFQHALKKYGFDAFHRYVLKVCDTREEAKSIESLLINEEFISRADTYNISLGGDTPPSSSKPVHQYDLQGNYIASFNSIREAAKKTNSAEQTISRSVLYGSIANNYYWSEDYYTVLDISNRTKKQAQLTYIYNSTTGILYMEFESKNETARYLDVTLSSIQKAIKLGTKVQGYYISDIKYDIYPIKARKKREINSPVYQYDLKGNFIAKFNNVREACDHCNIKINRIYQNIQLQRPLKDFYWSYEKYDKYPVQKDLKPRKRKVGRYDMDGNLLEVFESVRACREQYSNINKVLKGVCNTCKGFKFKYIDE